jgi:hypothetical protein
MSTAPRLRPTPATNVTRVARSSRARGTAADEPRAGEEPRARAASPTGRASALSAVREPGDDPAPGDADARAPAVEPLSERALGPDPESRLARGVLPPVVGDPTRALGVETVAAGAGRGVVTVTPGTVAEGSDTVGVGGGGGGVGTDGAGTDGAGTDGVGTEGVGTEGVGTDGVGTEGAGTDGVDTDGNDGAGAEGSVGTCADAVPPSSSALTTPASAVAPRAIAMSVRRTGADARLCRNRRSTFST